jgi:hypothetical protein
MLEVRVSASPATRELHIVGVDLPPVIYELAGQGMAMPANYDFAAVATVFLAMRLGRALHIRGAVSTTLLRNLEEFQEAWAAWRSGMYRPVRITCDEELPDHPPATAEGVFAFSGGVDATFALMRHVTGDAGRRAIRPRMAVLVHGFDIPLENDAAFRAAEDSAREMLTFAQVPLVSVRTNWRSVLCGDWESEFGAGLASCLHQFSGTATHGVFGADEDYANLSLPWGSNPVTNQFLSGGAFTLWTEGGGFTRTRRVAFLARHPDIAARLRVCWEGPMTGRNCGKCEKCIRTKLNFMVSGFPPLCFDGPPTDAEVLSLKPRNAVQCAYLREILAEAALRKVDAPWVDLLSQAVRAYERGPSFPQRLAGRAWREAGRARRAAGKVLRALHLR